MSYDNAPGGLPLVGLGLGGLGDIYPIGDRSDGIRVVQVQLQRLGYLQPGSGAYGADGFFGPRTATALRGAAGYVEWTDAPYTPAAAAEMRSGDVTIPQALIERLRHASPDASAPYAGNADLNTSQEPAADHQPPPHRRHVARRKVGFGLERARAYRLRVLPPQQEE